MKQAYINCGECNKLIEAERTHNGIAPCWLGHHCGYGQTANIGAETYLDLAVAEEPIENENPCPCGTQRCLPMYCDALKEYNKRKEQ